MPFAIQRVSLMQDNFSQELTWNHDVVGLTTSNVNIEIEAQGDDASIVGSLTMLVTSRVPNQELGVAGCSVLSIAFTDPPQGPALEWVRLLHLKGGPLTALLGYGATVLHPTPQQRQAPADNPVGNAIAAEMGPRIAAGSNDYVRSWLDINAQHHAWTAVAIDGHGVYSAITQDIPLLALYTVHTHQLP